MFAVVNPLRDRMKLAAAFGSYGWSGEAVEIIEANLKALKFCMFETPMAMKFRPDTDQKEQLAEYGRKFAGKLIAN